MWVGDNRSKIEDSGFRGGGGGGDGENLGVGNGLGVFEFFGPERC